ncbi:hypothetical protein AEGHOMDF_5395 [Methylobacterium soli]|nr:hypothetical protein AEGHOMDF_5395 [Methylobacterium soli]
MPRYSNLAFDLAPRPVRPARQVQAVCGLSGAMGGMMLASAIPGLGPFGLVAGSCLGRPASLSFGAFEARLSSNGDRS